MTESFAIVPCPTSLLPNDQFICFRVSGVGKGTLLGQMRFESFDVNYPPDPQITEDTCGPSTRQGSILPASGDAITFTAVGVWCQAHVQFDCQVTGGTGRYRRAGGRGSIYIPLNGNVGVHPLEYWSGTLTF